MQDKNSILHEFSTLKEDVLKIVTELIQQRRVVLIEELYKITRKETKAERLAIENVIDRLIQEKIIVPGTRITKQIILRNPTRRKIYEFIKQCPGVNINTIKKSLSLGSNSALWHVNVLVQFGCLQEVVYKTSSIYALPKIPAQEVLYQFLMRKNLFRLIFSTIEKQATSLADLAQVTGEDRPKIAYHLKILQELNFIERIAGGEDTSIIAYKILPNTQIKLIGIKNDAGEKPVPQRSIS